MTETAQLTPMLRHYLEVKAQHPDAILMYRMGDFYELFFEDARTAAPILEVALTARQKGTASEAPMCGVPHHALDTYLGKLLRAGRKVAICDQVEDPKTAKGMVRREVTRVVTPGTVSEPGLLDGREENLLACLVWEGAGGGGAFLEITTGSFFVRRWASDDAALEDLGVLRPREVLREEGSLPERVEVWVRAEVPCLTTLAAEDRVEARRASDLLLRQMGTATLRGFGLEVGEPAVIAAATALEYARETQHNELGHIRSLQLRDSAETMVVDATTLANLEVFRSQREGGRRSTLLAVLDRTATPPGARMLRQWLQRPLLDAEAIAARHDAVHELVEKGMLRDDLRRELAGLGDPERLLGRAVLGTMTPREAATLRDGLARVPALRDALVGCGSSILVEIAGVDPLAPLSQELERLLEAEPAAQLKNGGVIATGVDPELDDARSLARDSKQHILALQARERQTTGIPSLKIKYNRVFGYYLEVTRANQHLVPERYLRKQTLVNAERYVTPEVKELEEKILGAEATQIELEERYFAALQAEVAAAAEGLRRLAHSLATLDVIAGFAEVAAQRGYSRPRMAAMGQPIVVRDGRHPVVEVTTADAFVPNDVELDAEEAQIIVLTGPNMGGKSTYLRQVALISLMAQAGSWVPAASAELGVVDRIFTRVGASDDLARGESTFMVEMIETANILHHATEHSLVILDEVGRGTATFDGLSLAWAIVEHLHETGRPKTLFATHYHELTELAALLPRVRNRTLAVKEWEDRIIFLRRVVPGSADKSYGLQVARLAGIPPAVIQRAAEVLHNLEAQEYDMAGKPRRADGPSGPARGDSQLELFAPAQERILDILRELDLDQMTPIAALNLLASLKDRL